MRRLFLLSLFLGALFASPTPAAATTCFFVEQEDAGFYTICWYDCLGDRVPVTLRGLQICPLTKEL